MGQNLIGVKERLDNSEKFTISDANLAFFIIDLFFNVINVENDGTKKNKLRKRLLLNLQLLPNNFNRK